MMVRRLPSDPWGTVCSDGIKSTLVALAICRRVGVLDGRHTSASWTVLSGPPSAPLNLGGGSCPASLTSIDNCTWGSGTGAMLGPNSVGVPCSHNEDLWVTCPIASLFEVPPIEFRLIPLQGLNSTARTGSLEGRMAGTTMDWGQIVTADPSSFVTDSTGCAQNLCSFLYPDELEQQLVMRSQFLSPDWTEVQLSSVAQANEKIFFGFENVDLADLYVHTTKAEYDSNDCRPVILSCEVVVEISLEGGATNGTVEVTWGVPGVYQGPPASVCSPSAERDRVLLAESVCSTKFGSTFTGVPIIGNFAPPRDHVYQMDTVIFETSYQSWPNAWRRGPPLLGLVKPSLRKPATASCTGILFEVECSLANVSLDLVWVRQYLGNLTVLATSTAVLSGRALQCATLS